jgi:hypothetical protein
MMWIKTADRRPTNGSIVKTKIDDDRGVRNVDELLFRNNMWWEPTGQVYVYYTPTHWSG